MNREHPFGNDDASFAQLAAIDGICDRYEEAWRAGRRPAIEDYLAATVEPMRSEMLTRESGGGPKRSR